LSEDDGGATEDATEDVGDVEDNIDAECLYILSSLELLLAVIALARIMVCKYSAALSAR
jgi:hypothetical protein